MHLIIMKTPYSQSEPFEEALQSLAARCIDAEDIAGESGVHGLQEATSDAPVVISATTGDGYERVREWLESGNHAHLLAFHSAPASAIARALEDGTTTAAEAVEAYTGGARALTKIVRRNRRRTTMFDTDMARHAPEAFATAIGNRLGLEATDHFARFQDMPSGPGELHRIIAAQRVAADVELQELGDELEATSIPLGETEHEPVFDFEAALESLRWERKTRAEAEEEATGLKQQLAERDDQLGNAQSALEAKGAEIEELTAARDKATQNAEEIQRQLKESSEENELLLLQLHQVQEELETYYLDFQEREAARHETSTEAKPPASDDQRKRTTAKAPGMIGKLVAARKRAKRKRTRLRDAKALAASQWFDKKWYRAQYPDVASDKYYKKRLALHYVERGGFEGRSPGPAFDSAGYLEANPDVRKSGLNPLLHFMRYGRKEGRLPDPHNRCRSIVKEKRAA